jgi:peptide/nickel transport system substrate-binding protein
MKKRFFVVFFLIVVMVSSLMSDSGPKKDTLRVGIHTFPGCLNPVYTTDETGQAVINKVFDSLFVFDVDGKVCPGLVRDYRFRDNRTIVLDLKEGVYFSNGGELSAADAAATFGLLRNPDYKYPYLSSLMFIDALEQVGKYKIKITLKEPFAPWRNVLVFKILDAGEIKKADPRAFRSAVLSGTGPYQIERISAPSKIILALNSHFKSVCLFPRLEYRVIAYPHLMPLKLMNGETDVGELQPEHVRAYVNSTAWQERFNIVNYKKFGFTYLVFNLRNSKITTNIRRICYNRLICGHFIERFLKKGGEPVDTPFLLLKDKIKALPFAEPPLAETVRLRILTNSESKIRRDFVLFLKKELAPLKIELQPMFLEYSAFLDYLKKGRFDLAVSGFVLDIDYDMKDVFYSNAFFNYAHLKSGEMDRLLDLGLKEMDPLKREKIYLAAHRVWLEALPLLPLFNLYYYVGVSKRIPAPQDTCRLMSASGDFLQNIREWKTGTTPVK